MIDESIDVTVLVENTAIRDDLESEHGLSFWIRTKYGNLLWDTGQTGLLIKNAHKLDIPLHTATHIA